MDSFCNKTLSSRAGFKGILKKVAILCVVAVASIVGTCVFQSDALRTAVTLYYVSNEGISILENCTNIGIPIPKVLKSAISKTKDDSEEKMCIRDRPCTARSLEAAAAALCRPGTPYRRSCGAVCRP